MFVVDFEKGPMDFGREEIRTAGVDCEGHSPECIAAMVAIEFQNDGYRTVTLEIDDEEKGV